MLYFKGETGYSQLPILCTVCWLQRSNELDVNMLKLAGLIKTADFYVILYRWVLYYTYEKNEQAKPGVHHAVLSLEE